MQIMPDGAKSKASRQCVIETDPGTFFPTLADLRRFLVTPTIERGFLPGIGTVY
jgi:hypothetical protein